MDTKNAIAVTPPMGWNSWNTFGCEINEQLIMDVADSLVSSGYLSAGYEYLVIDDGWQAMTRENGRLVPDPKKFPAGMRALADYVHSKGLKFGIYSCAGNKTCAGYPGSFGNEFIDAETFAEWGADFLKFDYCYFPDWADPKIAYQKMGQALRETNRPMCYSICEWGKNQPWKWARNTGAHMWRTTIDMVDKWDSVRWVGFDMQNGLSSYAGPQGWNDPDMLVVGLNNQGFVAEGGCTQHQYVSHFSLWCMLAAPLMIGADIRSIDNFSQRLLQHPDLVAINQDPLGIQANRIIDSWQNDMRRQIWVKPLANGDMAVGGFNLSDQPMLLELATGQLPLNPDGQYQIRRLTLDGSKNRRHSLVHGEQKVQLDAFECAIFLISKKD